MILIVLLAEVELSLEQAKKARRVHDYRKCRRWLSHIKDLIAKEMSSGIPKKREPTESSNQRKEN